MKLPIANFFMQTKRTHSSVSRETGLTRHCIERWITEHKPVYIEFDGRSEVIQSITEEPLIKTHYKRRSI